MLKIPTTMTPMNSIAQETTAMWCDRRDARTKHTVATMYTTAENAESTYATGAA